jgi:Fe-S cluster biogenesis protein NfuA
MKDDIRKQIQEALEEIRPILERDGGGIELIDYDEEMKKVSVRFQGACQGCPMAQITLETVVGAHLREKCPFIQEVVKG